MVTETDRNKARSAVVSAYNTLDCVTIPFSFLHAFADAAVDAISTDAAPAKPYGYIVELRTIKVPHKKAIARSRVQPYLQVAKACVDHWKTIYREDHWRFEIVPLYAEPVKTAPAVALTRLAIRTGGSGANVYAFTEADDDGDYVFYTEAKSALAAQVQDVAGNEDLDENALSLAAQAYQRKFRDMLGPAPTEEPKAGDGPLGYAIRAYLSSVSVKVQDSDVLESNPVTLRWWCQQLLDIIENYDISHDAPEEEIALLNDIRAAVDPASPASKHGDAE